MTRYLSWPIACALAVFLTACGFHLRGLGDTAAAQQYPFRSIYIDSSLQIGNEITARLKADPRVRVLTSAANADAVLRILSENKSKDISLIGRDGLTKEYRLSYTVRAQLLMKGYQIGPNIVLRQSRTMTYSDSVVLGKDQEEALLWNDMSRQTSQVILYRLASTQMRQAASEAEASAALGKVPDAVTQP